MSLTTQHEFISSRRTLLLLLEAHVKLCEELGIAEFGQRIRALENHDVVLLQCGAFRLGLQNASQCLVFDTQFLVFDT